jgi:hypothetical protein
VLRSARCTRSKPTEYEREVIHKGRDSPRPLCVPGIRASCKANSLSQLARVSVTSRKKFPFFSNLFTLPGMDGAWKNARITSQLGIWLWLR